jgi:hypothetical protein
MSATVRLETLTIQNARNNGESIDEVVLFSSEDWCKLGREQYLVLDLWQQIDLFKLFARQIPGVTYERSSSELVGEIGKIADLTIVCECVTREEAHDRRLAAALICAPIR